MALVAMLFGGIFFQWGPTGSRALKPARDLINWFAQTFDARKKNDELNAEVQTLRAEIVAGEAARAENAELRPLLRLKRSGVLPAGLDVVTALVVGRSPDDRFSSLEVNRGAADCIKTGDVAFNGAGLVGKVDLANQHTAEIRLVTDGISAVSAKVESSDVRGLVKPLAGQPGRLALSFINRTKPPQAGQEILTSGWQGNEISSGFPANIPIGRLTNAPPSKVAATGSVPLKLFADLDNLSLVQILTGCPTG